MRLGISQSLVLAAMIALGLLLQPLVSTGVSANEEDDSPITATNAIVVDADSGQVLFAQDMEEQVAPASLTKIFTAIVALETAPLERELVVDEYDLVGEASIGLIADETVTMETLLHGLMLTSGNDSAMTVARELGYLPGDTPQESVSRFIERVNSTAHRLDLEDTTLRNPHGLDQDGHLSTASDIAAMTMYALDNPVFSELIGTPYYEFNGREFYNVNEFLDGYPGVVGGKTGITENAGHSLMQIAERDGKRVIVVLLGSTRDDWYADAEYLLDRGFEELGHNPDDSERHVIGRSNLDVPELTMGASVGGNLEVDRVNEHEAVIRASSPISDEESDSWRWLVASVGMMGVALVMVLHYPTIIGIGALALYQGSRIRVPMPSLSSIASPKGLFRRRESSRRPPRQHVGWQPPTAGTDRQAEHARTDTSFRHAGNGQQKRRQGDELMNQGTYQPTIELSPARTRAEQAIKLAMQGRYHVATEEFRQALERDPEVDFTNCPGFWRMQPMGFIAAAKAYTINNQKDDARRLLTVVQLAFEENTYLSSLFGRAIKEINRP